MSTSLNITLLGCYLSGTSKIGYLIFTAKTTHQDRITAHGPSQLARALPCSKPKPEDKRPSPPALLRFVRPLSVSPNPHDVIQAPEPCDVIKALDPPCTTTALFDPHCNTLPRVCMGPYPFLLRTRSLPRRAGLPGNL
jgi:hypothetical protein